MKTMFLSFALVLFLVEDHAVGATLTPPKDSATAVETEWIFKASSFYCNMDEDTISALDKLIQAWIQKFNITVDSVLQSQDGITYIRTYHYHVLVPKHKEEKQAPKTNDLNLKSV